ncbi:MAG: hypothetical protein M5U28_26430 [Sandaracinaceae bacterium]|nr:hypothetical protein [Sandaracinaceae bacterium]
MPTLKRSLRASRSFFPRACSGDMYCGVPTTTPVRVARPPAPKPREMPKSTSFGKMPSASSTRKMFSGLTSRWRMPASCTAASPLRVIATISSTSQSVTGGPSL